MDALIINALNMVNLNVTPETYIKDLSGGMKQKLAIVETILQQSKNIVFR
ncbi:Duplicated ATPase component YkoD of energizingmodule of thiamin-regulated ECF transporter [Staphylococcus aureus]|uniref:Duplicated ATPase component YkoD of energizingmodule of thiamin-regulated ECF transporter n=1 Tax=Staphylococcus aureus TaxID=1280 RepID=A0A380E0L8_STAAU|nr:Duplicated ATPase component YkoD of energizingmodule of thiamin-regulated ECF transporter [Staphylococcus aureus]